MASVEIHPEAQDEVNDAAEYYVQSGMWNSLRFRTRLDEIIDLIATQPELFGWYDDDFRMALPTPYPYAVIYRELPGNIVQLIAVAHTCREPGYWKDRVS